MALLSILGAELVVLLYHILHGIKLHCPMLIFIPKVECLLAQADIVGSHPSIKPLLLKERGGVNVLFGFSAQ